MIGFDKTTVEEGGSKFIIVTKENPIQEVFLENIETVKEEGKNAYLDITVKNAANQSCRTRYYEPSVDGNIIKTDEDLKKAVDKAAKITKNLATKILGEDYSASGKDFSEFWNNVIKSIKAKKDWDKIKFAALFVHNKDGFTRLRTFSPVFATLDTKDKLIPGTWDNYTEPKKPSVETGIEKSADSPFSDDVF